MKTDENGLSYCIRFSWNQLLCRSLGRSDCAPISLFYKRSEQTSYWSSLYPTFVSAWRDKILNLLCLILLLQIRLQKQLQRTSQWKTYQVRLSISRVFSREFSRIFKVWAVGIFNPWISSIQSPVLSMTSYNYSTKNHGF